MRLDPKEIGMYGEKLVAQHMLELGFLILGTNYSSNYGEIDVIALDGETLAFVEVKTRKTTSWVSGGEAVTGKKQKKIIKTALVYLSENQMDYQARFDVGTVVYDDKGNIQIDYLKSAFDATALDS